MVYPERRRNLRVSTNINVMIGFIFPEETFPLKDRHARALDIGEQGMKLKISDVSEDFHSKLTSDPRSAKVSFALPNRNITNYILVRIVWSDFDPEKQECFFGLNFKRVPADISQAMHEYIEICQHPRPELA